MVKNALATTLMVAGSVILMSAIYLFKPVDQDLLNRIYWHENEHANGLREKNAVNRESRDKLYVWALGLFGVGVVLLAV